MKREVKQKNAAILRIKCSPVKNLESVQPIILDLNDTIDYLKTTYAYPRGIGLAAPQIGKSVRVSILENAETKERYVLINPQIIATSQTKKPIREGCISFLQYRGNVPRFEYVKVEALNQQGEKYIIEGQGDFSMLLQHEIDHLNGILYYDHLRNQEADLYLVK